jgi:HAD superfamily hydrolase (TIGR01490 family)
MKYQSNRSENGAIEHKASIFDVDNTLAKGFYIIKFPEALYEENMFSGKELNSIREVFSEYKKGHDYSYEQFAWDLVNAFGRGVKGKKQHDIQNLGSKYLSIHPEEKFSFTDGLVKMVKEKGYKTLIISGSPAEIVIPFSQSIGVDKTFATTYETDEGVFTGHVLRNYAVNNAKSFAIQLYFDQNNINPEECIGFGDSDQDVSILKVVGYPVAVKPGAELEKIAAKNKWLICKDEEKLLDDVKRYLPA